MTTMTKAAGIDPELIARLRAEKEAYDEAEAERKAAEEAERQALAAAERGEGEASADAWASTASWEALRRVPRVGDSYYLHSREHWMNRFRGVVGDAVPKPSSHEWLQGFTTRIAKIIAEIESTEEEAGERFRAANG